MPRSRTKWTVRKTRKASASGQILGCDPNAPTAGEWATMVEYEGFSVSDEEDAKEQEFQVNDIALVLPNGKSVGSKVPLHKYWVCKVLEVRSRSSDNAESSRDVWVKVLWYYSAQDAAEKLDSEYFDPFHCGDYERISSNHIDCVSSAVFEDMAIVKHYRETDLDQESIRDGEFYYRYDLDTVSHTLKPKPGSNTCICEEAYDPSDPSPERLMHFCLQPSCRKFYHSSCIASKKSAPAAERDLSFLLCSPDTGEPLPRPDADAASDTAPEPPKKKRRASKNKSNSSSAPAIDPTPLLAPLPPTLVSAAAQPIVKGAAFPAGGVVGNIAAVVAARRLVYDALLREDHSVPDGWEEFVDLNLADVQLAWVRHNGKLAPVVGKRPNVPVLLALECPGCGGPI
ncbi:hypothetical protein B0H10DRAFT_2012909 [Mycena sp. CBHHK59/15]|nr:hypothetical protein B0H10DRAFT_2012909 [Mycena sp. CBHHK59/15]